MPSLKLANFTAGVHVNSKRSLEQDDFKSWIPACQFEDGRKFEINWGAGGAAINSKQLSEHSAGQAGKSKHWTMWGVKDEQELLTRSHSTLVWLLRGELLLEGCNGSQILIYWEPSVWVCLWMRIFKIQQLHIVSYSFMMRLWIVWVRKKPLQFMIGSGAGIFF